MVLSSYLLYRHESGIHVLIQVLAYFPKLWTIPLIFHSVHHQHCLDRDIFMYRHRDISPFEGQSLKLKTHISQQPLFQLVSTDWTEQQLSNLHWMTSCTLAVTDQRFLSCINALTISKGHVMSGRMKCIQWFNTLVSLDCYKSVDS